MAESTANPVYIDTPYVSNREQLNFRIESPQGTVIHRGTVSTKPDGSPPIIYVNRLCEPFLDTSLDPTKTGITSQGGATRTFYLYNDLNDALLETYTFLRSYSGEWSNDYKPLSDPIRPSISKDMVIPLSAFNRSAFQLTIISRTI